MRKGQLQIGESIFIVVFILLIIVFGIVFYSGAHQESVVEEQQRLAELESIELAQIATAIPEIQCSLTNVQEPSCFEIQKMNSFTNVSRRSDYARQHLVSKLGDAQLVVEEVYPGNKTWVLYNNTKENNMFKQSLPAIVPVSLHDAVSDRYGFGTLYIRLYT